MGFTANGNVINCGPGGQYATLRDAVNASHPGDTIAVAPGHYSGDTVVITHDLQIVGTGGRPVFETGGSIDNGKGILDIENGANVVIDNLDLSGTRSSGGFVAAIRHEGHDLTVRNSSIHDNALGIFAGDNPGANIRVEHSEFANNGRPDEYMHGIYVDHINSLTVTDSLRVSPG